VNVTMRGKFNEFVASHVSVTQTSAFSACLRLVSSFHHNVGIIVAAKYEIEREETIIYCLTESIVKQLELK